MSKKFDYDFSGWATRNDIECADGRTIKRDAFLDDDGVIVPLVYQHNHSEITNVLGHALLCNRPEGVYMYGKFNDTYEGQHAKATVQSGDITSLSIYAKNLKHAAGKNVVHGSIKEVSLVIAPANPGAVIDYVTLAHGEGDEGDEAVITTSYGPFKLNLDDIPYEGEEPAEELTHADEPAKKEEKEEAKPMPNAQKTIQDVLDTLNDEQKSAVQAAIGYAVEHADEIKKSAVGDDDDDDDDDEVSHSDNGGSDFMNHNVFDNNDDEIYTLSHADQENILATAKNNRISFRQALDDYCASTLQHGIDDIESLFPDYHDVYTGEPETFKRDLSWVGSVINGVHKAPYARVRTRFADARAKDLRAKGYIKGDKKTIAGNIKLLKRTTDPQTIYRKDALERDDIIDITDFDVVNYQWKIMRENLEEDIALAILVGDDRDDEDREQIKPEHVRPIWTDEELYTLHADIDFDTMKTTLQGTETGAHFSDNYVYAEAMVQTLLYTREKYKGSGNLVMYCTPHLINQMLLSRDLNGRRIYQNRSDLLAALDVSAIHTVEQLEGRVRTTEDNKQKKLVALFVNLNDYQVGSVKGGEITKFQQFDIDFNQEKMLMETRISGALIKPWSAIAIEEDVTA
jgi:phage head maturation protease